MPVIAGRTRTQLRQSIGYNLGAVYTSTASATGTTTSWIDATLSTVNDAYNGKWIVVTQAGSNLGLIRYIADYTGTTTALTLRTALTAAPVSGDSYEIWDSDYPPQRMNDFINQAIMDSYSAAIDIEEDITLHGNGFQTRFRIPPEFSYLTGIYYRADVQSLLVHPMDTVFTETTNANFTQLADTQDKRQGSASLRCTIGSGVVLGNRITHAISSTNLAKYDALEFWVKSSTALAANDFRILLDNGIAQGDSTDMELLNVPATVAYAWQFSRITLANPRLDTAIVSVGLQYNANVVANTVWFDDLRVVVTDSAVWRKIHPREWSVNREDRDLVLTAGGVNRIGNSLIKLVGGGEPILLSAEGTVNEVSDFYVIARATELALASLQRPRSETEERRLSYWADEARRARQAFPLNTVMRAVE